MGTTGESHRAARGGRVFCLTVAVLAALAGQIASAQDLPRGQVIGEVECQDAPSQHYALYLPSNFTRTRQWPVIIALDAAARGREGVERYQAAAERYGYIVAGSNNSRNGPWELGLDAAQAMTIDLKKRFPVDSRRLYTAGMSGGARVAIKVALNSDSVAGVLASSAGYAEEFLESVRFPLFGSAGTEDFNYREMHAIDLRMKSPHRVEVFEGGHTWLPVDMATDGVEWMEVQAMKSGLRPRDNRLIDELFVKRLAHAEAQPGNLAKMRALNLIAKDFDGFKDVAAVAKSAATLERQPDVADALRAEHEDDLYEGQIANELNRLLRQLGWPEREGAAFVTLKAHVTSLLKAARTADDSAERRMARRALAGLRASSRGIPHADFREFMQQAELPAAVAPPQ
jgi:dienelactone hydrolase